MHYSLNNDSQADSMFYLPKNYLPVWRHASPHEDASPGQDEVVRRLYLLFRCIY